MKRGWNLFVFLLGILVLSSVVSASQVGYVFEKQFRVNDGYVEALEEMGHTVKMINARNIPRDLSNYDLLVVGNEKFKKSTDIPMGEVPMIVSNSFHTDAWGLTDDDGVSQMGSTKPMKVMAGNKVIQVYDTGLKERRIAVSYSYLKNENKMGESMAAASAMRGGSGELIGDVVSYFDGEERVCFFGLMESEYWTADAKNLFKDCVSFALDSEVPDECNVDLDCGQDQQGSPVCQSGDVYREITSFSCGENNMCSSSTNMQKVTECGENVCSNGACVEDNEPISCNNNADCGTDGFVGSEMCSEGGNVVRDFKTWTCNNPGTTGSSCSSTTTQNVVTECDFGCTSGTCNPEPNDGMVHDVALVDFSTSVNQIKIENRDGVDILAGESLMCNERYVVSVTVDNVGNFTENIDFVADAGGVSFPLTAIENLPVGERRARTRTVNMTLGAGGHDITVRAMLNGTTDSDISNNVARRTVNIVCN